MKVGVLNRLRGAFSPLFGPTPPPVLRHTSQKAKWLKVVRCLLLSDDAESLLDTDALLIDR